jgi:hypothetical protein
MYSISSAVSVDSLSVSSEPGCALSHSASAMNTAEPSLENIGQASPASMTSTALTQTDWIGLDESILSVEDSPASPSPSPESASRTRTTATSGRKCAALLHSRDPLGLLAKTLLASSRWRSTLCSLSWKPMATPQGRLLFRLVPLVLTTEETASGLLPTLTAQSYGTNQGGAMGRVGKVRPSLETMARQGLLPTLTARDHKSDSCSQLVREKRDALKTGKTLPWTLGGLMNPRWCEAYMGYPPGWTELEPSEMPSSRKSSKKSAAQSCA